MMEMWLFAYAVVGLALVALVEPVAAREEEERNGPLPLQVRVVVSVIVLTGWPLLAVLLMTKRRRDAKRDTGAGTGEGGHG